MGVNSEKTISQRLNGSPAQIWVEDSDLATVIFGSNSDAIVFSEKFAFGCAHTRTHAHTQ